MNDLEIILYILATLVWLFARNYRKVKQNRPGADQGPAPAEPFDEIQDPFSDPAPKEAAIPGTMQPAPVSSTAEETVPGYNPPVVGEFDTPHESGIPATGGPKPQEAAYTFDAGSTEAEKVAAYYARMNDESDHVPAVSGNGDDGWNVDAGNFDLRMAVVYDAILKRPDF